MDCPESSEDETASLDADPPSRLSFRSCLIRIAIGAILLWFGSCALDIPPRGGKEVLLFSRLSGNQEGLNFDGRVRGVWRFRPSIPFSNFNYFRFKCDREFVGSYVEQRVLRQHDPPRTVDLFHPPIWFSLKSAETPTYYERVNWRKNRCPTVVEGLWHFPVRGLALVVRGEVATLWQPKMVEFLLSEMLDSAKSPATPPADLTAMSFDAPTEVRIEVAKNPNTPLATLRIMTGDLEARVKRAAKECHERRTGDVPE